MCEECKRTITSAFNAWDWFGAILITGSVCTTVVLLTTVICASVVYYQVQVKATEPVLVAPEK